MPVETFGFINSLNASNPVGATDPKSQGDDHIRGIKSTLLATFPNITGAITLTQTQINAAAIKSEANVFTANQSIETTSPLLRIKDTDASVDEKVSRISGASDLWRLQFLDDAEAVARNVISITRTGNDPGTIDLYNGAGLIRFRTAAGGIVAVRSDGNTDTENRELVLAHQDGNERGSIGHQGGSRLDIVNRIHGANIALIAENVSGTGVNLLEGDPDGQLLMYYAGTLRLETRSAGTVSVRGDGNTDAEIRRLEFRYADGTLRGWVGNSTDSIFRLASTMHGASVRIQGEDSGGSAKIILNGSPDGVASLYYAGSLRLDTRDQGARLYSAGNTDTENRYLGLMWQDGTFRGRVGFVGDSDLNIRCDIHGGRTILTAEDTGGTLRTLFVGDPDGDTEVRGDTTLTLSVAAGTVDAAVIQADGGIVTENNEADEFGFKGAPINVQNGNYTLALTDCGKTVRKESGGAGETYTVPDTGLWPVGTIIIVHNDGGGDLTIAAGGVTTIEAWNGSTGNKTLPDNNKAILEYVGGNAWKYSSTG